MSQTIVLGLDGATWDVLNPLIEDSELPNLETLVDTGYSGTLESTFPPITAPAWLSMATSNNPGKTGVFYFLNRESSDGYDFKSFGSEKFRGKSFWDILDSQGQSVGVFNYPMLYPPYDVNGFMVSGMVSPEDETITYPETLKQELDEVTDGYEVKVPYADPKYLDRPDELFTDLIRVLEKRGEAMEYLLREKNPDVFFGVISVTDWAQHYFWRYHDKNHVLYDPDSDHEDKLKRVWQKVDEVVGNINEFVKEEDATLFIVSDHGFGPVNHTFRVNNWLTQKGFRKEKKGLTPRKIRTKYFPYIRSIGERVVSVVPQLNDIAVSAGKRIRGSPSEEIDWEESTAFASKQGFASGLIYVLSDDSTDRESVVSELNELENEHRDKINVDIYAPDDLYHGENTKLAPDILFVVNNYECAVDPRTTTGDQDLVNKPPSESRSGGHRSEGIYLLAGKGSNSGNGEKADILDVAPTILYCQNSPIPESMDGSVLDDGFSKEFVESRESQRVPLTELVDIDSAEMDRDEGAVKDRLNDLGYI